MNNTIFVNAGFTSAVNDYLNNKSIPEGIKYNSFLVVVIRMLTIIYDELDIINPFYLNNEMSLDSNLQKYGYSHSKVMEFKEKIQSFYEKENDSDFIEIQKMLIDMFMKKKVILNISDTEIETFKQLLYSPSSANPLMVSYNFLITNTPFKVIEYFDASLTQNIKRKSDKPKETLNLEAYELFKYSLEDIKNMSSDELDTINKKIYNYFQVNENAINKTYLLDKAVYDFKNPKPSYSTGNGYVDILFIMGLVATLGMIILLITFFIL